jgi:hypothetical protein
MKMKATLFAVCLFSASAAFAQYGTISSEPRPFASPSHPAHASYTALSAEQSVVGGGNYSTAQGERRASDFPQADEVSLGAAARELKKQHAELKTKKSPTIWIN